MPRYRKVDIRTHNDEKFRTLSAVPCGQLLWFNILTHPNMTPLGAMRATEAGLAAEFGWDLKGFSKAFHELLSKGMVKHDPAACFLWLPNFLRYNSPENPNVVRSWANVLDLLPECSLRNQMIQSVKEFTEGLSEPFRKALPEPFRKDIPIQEQEQEQEQEEEIARSRSSGPESAVCWIPTVGNGKGEFPVKADAVERWTKAFPGIDVLAEIEKARTWCIDNPTRRKTPGGVPRFLNTWLSRAQNESRGGSDDHRTAPAAKRTARNRRALGLDP